MRAIIFTKFHHVVFIASLVIIKCDSSGSFFFENLFGNILSGEYSILKTQKSTSPTNLWKPTYKLCLCWAPWTSAVPKQFPMSRSPALGHLADLAQPTLGSRWITCRSHSATRWKHFNRAPRKHGQSRGVQNYFSWAKTMFIDFDPYRTGVAACGVEGRYLNVIIIRVIFSPI